MSTGGKRAGWQKRVSPPMSGSRPDGIPLAPDFYRAAQSTGQLVAALEDEGVYGGSVDLAVAARKYVQNLVRFGVPVVEAQAHAAAIATLGLTQWEVEHDGVS